MLTTKNVGGIIAGSATGGGGLTVKITRGVVGGGKKLKPGDIYTGPDARLLANMGKAVVVEAGEPEPEKEPEPVELETSSGAKIKSSKKGVKIKRVPRE